MDKKTFIVPTNQPTFDEFKVQISSLDEAEKAFDKVSDWYDRLPTLIKLLPNLDPTGIAGVLHQALSDNTAKREQENILKALYGLYQAISHLDAKQTKIEAVVQEQLYDLTYLYFLKSKEVYDTDKINYYKNVWINSITRSENTLEEKAYVFEVVSSLSVHELAILAFIEDKQKEFAFDDRPPISVDEIAVELEISTQQAQQMCINLAGKGLLHDRPLAFLDYPGPKYFVMTDYVLLIAKYLELP